MDGVRIRRSGSFAVEDGDGPLVVGGRKSRRLLARLAAAHGGPVAWTTTPRGITMTDLMTGLDDVKTRTAEALRATQADGGASVVTVAVVRKFDDKAAKGRAADDRDAVIELEQAGDSAKAAAEADPGLGSAAREAVLAAHLAICILKTTV